MNMNQLFQREQEIMDLKSCFNRMLKGSSESVFVIGDTGVGKSTFVEHTINQMLMDHKQGFLLCGKCNPVHSNIPFYGIKQALNELVLQLLMLDDAESTKWVQRFQSVLGSNYNVLYDFVPDLKLLTPSTVSLSKQEKKKMVGRFRTVLKRLLQCFDEFHTPLVLFIDDIQWSDNDTMDFFNDLLIDSDLQRIMFIGSFRPDNKEKHYKNQLLNYVTPAMGFKTIELESFSYQQTLRYIEAFYNHKLINSEYVAYFLFKKTGGNPLFISQLLNELIDQQMITPSLDNPAYFQVTEGLETLSISNDVQKYLVSKINKLPEAQLDFIKFLAVLGGRFSVSNINEIYYVNDTDLSVDETVFDLLDCGILVPSKDRKSAYEFIHDKVHRNVVDLMTDTEKELHNYKIGMYYFNQLETKNDQLKAVDYLDKAMNLVVKPKDRIRLAQLNYEVGLQIKESVAFESALKYFQMADYFIPENPFEWNEEFTYELHMEMAECEYLTKNKSKALQRFNILEQNVKNKKRLVDILLNKVDMYTVNCEYEKAITSGLKGLKLLGVDIPINPTNEDICEYVLKTKSCIQSNVIWDVMKQDEIDDESVLKMLHLLVSMGAPASNTNTRLMLMVLMKLVCISREHGNSVFSPVVYSGYGLLCSSILDQSDDIKNVVTLVEALMDRYTDPSINCIAHFTLGAFVTHWVHPLQKSIDHLEKAIKNGADSGNVLFVSYSIILKIQYAYFKGSTLSEVKEICEQYREFAEEYKLKPLMMNIIMFQHHLSYLDKGDIYDLRSHLASDYLSMGTEFTYYLRKAQTYYYIQLYTEAEAMIDICKRYVEKCGAYFEVSEYVYYEGLILAKTYDYKSEMDKKKVITRMDEIVRTLKTWADKVPENYLGKYFAISGEICRLTKSSNRCIIYYKQAIKAFEKYPYVQNKATVYDLIGQTYEAKGYYREANEAWSQAYGYYKTWGCNLRANYIEERLKGTSNTHAKVEEKTQLPKVNKGINLADLDHVIKGILEETDEKRGIENFMSFLYDDVQPKRVSLVLYHNKQFYPIATRSYDKEDITFEYDEHGEHFDYPQKMYKVAVRCNDHMTYNMQSPGVLAKENYFKQNKIYQGHCFPIVLDEGVGGIVYIEFDRHHKEISDASIKRIEFLCKQLGYSRCVDSVTRKIVLESQNSLVNQLTKREREILGLMTDGLTNKEIAESLMLSQNTIKTHIKGIYRKLDVNRRVQAVELAQNWKFNA